MSGGMAFVYDRAGVLPRNINPDGVIHQRVETDYWEELLKGLIAAHVRETQSRFAERLLIDWQSEREAFWQIVPKEMLERLEHPVTRVAEEAKRA
jgi:glutamate synthase (NADPH/NADH) large chain